MLDWRWSGGGARDGIGRGGYTRYVIGWFYLLTLCVVTSHGCRARARPPHVLLPRPTFPKLQDSSTNERLLVNHLGADAGEVLGVRNGDEAVQLLLMGIEVGMRGWM